MASPGPLAHGRELESTQIYGMRKGGPFTWGGPVLTNREGTPATLERAVVIGTAPRILGTAVFGPGAGHSIGDYSGWPPQELPRKHIHDIKGTVIPPGGHAQVVVGIEPHRTGDFLLQGFRVDYRMNGRRYSDVFRIRLRMCIGHNRLRCTRIYGGDGLRR